MSESLRNDGRVWAPVSPEVAKEIREGKLNPNDIAEDERDYFLERKYPSFGNLAPRDISSRSAKEACDEGRGVAPTGLGVFLDFRDAIARDGKKTIEERYGNLFEMYKCITGQDPYTTPMMIFPAVHYTMGGLWVDYNLQSTIPGMFVGGEANFSDHGANRLGASALMQGLADGYFVLPYTVGNYLGELGIAKAGSVTTDHPAFAEVEDEVKAHIEKLMSIGGTESPRSFHKRLGDIVWDKCGMARSEEGLKEAIRDIQALRKEFWSNLRVTGDADNLNPELERAGRVADFIDFGELMCRDALMRDESCGGHFRVEHQTAEGEAVRNDEDYAFVSVWEYMGEGVEPILNKDQLEFEAVKLTTRSYK
jgi:succinate dehydrogenase / fumarate reductase flavoprotein subunit